MRGTLDLAPKSSPRRSVGPSILSTAFLAIVLLISSCGSSAPSPPVVLTPSFTLSVTNPTISLQQLGTAQGQIIQVNSVNGFSGTVNVSFQNLPTGISVSPAGPYTIAAGQGQPVSISASSTSATGNLALTLSGTSGSLNNSTTFIAAVSAATPSFQLSVQAPSIQIQQQGISQGQNIQINPMGGFSGAVSVSFQNLPTGVSVTPPGPYSIVAGQSQSVMISASNSAAVGNYTLTLNGTGGTLTSNTSFTVAVSAAASFQLSAQPSSLSLTPGSTANILLTLSSNSGPPPNVVLNLPLQLPNTGLTTVLNPTSPQPNEYTISVQASPVAQSLFNFPLSISVAQVSNQSNTSVLSVPVTVTNLSPTTASPTRSTMIRTDMDPTGAVYDQARKLLFVTVSQLNEVLVYSTLDGSLRAKLSVTAPRGVDESLDGTEVFVGGGGSSIAVIDPDLLEITQLLPGPPPVNSNPAFQTEIDTPETLATLSNGKVLVQVGSFDVSGFFFLWDPSSGAYSPENIQPGVIVSRSADHSKVLLGSPNEPSSLVLYDAPTDTFNVSGSIVTTGATSGLAALNPNGSQIAFPSGQNVILFDDSFNQIASITLNQGDVLPPQLFYSLDGRYIYVTASAGGVAPSVIAVVDSQSFRVVGVVPSDFSTSVFAVDETGMLFGVADRAIAFTDASSPSDIQLPIPGGLGLSQTLLSPSAPTQITLSGSNFNSNSQYQMFFGPAPASSNAQSALNLSVTSSSAIQLTAPSSKVLGAANATLTRPDGWNAILPDEVSYGPQILVLSQNAGPASGGTKIVVYGYGFLSSNTTLTIGGVPAQVSQVFGPGFISPFPFPMDEIKATVPPGAAGVADVTVTTPDGSSTLSGGFQYLAQAQVYPMSGSLNQIIYDQTRQRLYASNTNRNRVEIFSLSSQSYLTPIAVGHNPGGIALTPDSSKLAVLNSGDGTVSVVNPDTQAIIATYPAVTQADVASGCGGVPVAMTAAGSHGVFVFVDCAALTSNGTLHFLDLNTGSLVCSSLSFCDASGTNIVTSLIPGLGLDVLASSSDGGKVLVAGDLTSIFDMNANTAVKVPPLTSPYDASVDADGNRFVVDFGIYDTQLNIVGAPQDLDYLDAGAGSVSPTAGEKFNPSGSLFFVPQSVQPGPSSVDVYDVYRGRLLLRISLPDPIPGSLNCMALDETSSKIFLITNTGISVLQLSVVPLSIASVTAPTASAGTQVTIRGSGFVTGATVTFGMSIASATVVDGNTIQATVPSLPSGPVRITVKNPNGNQYSFDAGFSVQ
jgi:DNA-binding beta-propeller fold protein YncE